MRRLDVSAALDYIIDGAMHMYSSCLTVTYILSMCSCVTVNIA
jgi:hypothetical protein